MKVTVIEYAPGDKLLVELGREVSPSSLNEINQRMSNFLNNEESVITIPFGLFGEIMILKKGGTHTDSVKVKGRLLRFEEDDVNENNDKLQVSDSGKG